MLRAKFTDLTFRFSTFGTRFSAGATVDSSSESHSGLEEGTGQSALEGTPIDGEGETEGEGSS